MRNGNTRAALLLLLSLAGCASQEGLQKHSTPAAPQGLLAARTLASAPVRPDAWPSEQWWKALGDPQLDRLVDEALAASPSIRLARARVSRALALAEAAGAPRTPQVGLDIEATRERLSEHGIFPPPLAGKTIWQNVAQLNFSYEFDFWGRNRAALESALGAQRAAEADAREAALVLSSALAAAYVQLARTLDQLDLAKELLAQRERQLDLVRERLAAGLDSRIELKQAEGAPHEARQRIAQLEETAAVTRHQIAALLGQGPDRGLALERPALAAGPLALPSQLPVDLLGRRPDIVASRWRVEAAAQDAEAARAEFYPNINLIAFIGFQAISWTHFLDAGSLVPGIGPALRLPVFDGGRLRGNLGAKYADYDAAAEQYNQALADALRDVADQLASMRSIDRQRAQAAQGVKLAQDGYDLAMLRYREGLGNYLQVLLAESQVLAQRNLQATLAARGLEASVSLTRALGGGYEPD